jgi:hypothetical protein
MEDKRESGYPVYAEDVLGGIASVASAGDTTGLEPTPPSSGNEADAYAALGSIPKPLKKTKKRT